ncbi:MAG TPA: hypothetical protein VFR48_03235 [Solirubrobacteraceae bacterium]|nr:hypothetical protein [Solirubrobacteraceae bacterium]
MSDRVIVSMGIGPQQNLLRIARRTIEPYARRHGYDLDLHTRLLEQPRPASWMRVPILRKLVERYELVVWLDADIVIVDGRDDIATELDDEHFLYLAEHRKDGSQMPNAGVMMLRGGEQAANFLDQLWAMDQYVDHQWWENAAICELLGYELDPPRPGRPTPLLQRTKIISPRWNTIVGDGVRRARIRHFAGYKTRTRAALMTAATVEARTRSLLGR